MIKSLHIDNYALLKKVVINFHDGFTCISGETGAGKSIMLDALSLLLGKRVERFSTSKNTTKSIIEGVFILKEHHRLFFKDHNLDFEYETIIRREITAKGKSRAFINDTPVLVQTLSLFGKQIIEIYAQDQTIVLKDENSQFQLIDQLSKSTQYLNNYHEDYTAWNQLKKDLEVIKSQGSLSATEIEFLEFQYEELTSANIFKGEKEEIEGKINLLENVDGIANAITEGEVLLNREQGVINYLTIIKRQLVDFDNLSDLAQRLESIIIELNDINTEFSTISSSLNTDPQELIQMNSRLDLINGLLQKHRLTFVEQLIELKDDFHARIELSSSFDILLDEKQQLIDIKYKKLAESVNMLNKSRLKILPKIKKEVERILKKLGIVAYTYETKIIQSMTVKYSSLGNSESITKL